MVGWQDVCSKIQVRLVNLNLSCFTNADGEAIFNYQEFWSMSLIDMNF